MKLSADGGGDQPAGKGLGKQENEAANQDPDELSSSESEYYESSSTDEEEEKRAEPVSKPAPVSSSYGSSADVEQSSDSDSDGSTPDSKMPAVGRGTSRGRGRAGRGRWSRGSRASFNRGRGTGRSASRAAVAPGGVPLPQANRAKPQLKAAALLAKVQRTVVAPATESSDDLTSSDDDELEQLAQEVKRFEKMMHKKIAVPGFVPVFTAPEQGKGASELFTLDTIMQKRILKRERQLYNPDEEDLMDSIAGYEMTQMEKLAAGKQPVAPTKDISAETATASVQQSSPGPSHAAAQKVLSETDEDIEIEISGETYLVDLESGLVFHLIASGEPPEVGTWNTASRLIEFG